MQMETIRVPAAHAAVIRDALLKGASDEQVRKAITQPTAGDVHVNRPLSNFTQTWLQDQALFACHAAWPRLGVSNQSDQYYTFSREDFFRDEATIRADGAESAGSGFTLSTDTYSAQVRSIHKDVTDRQRANADPGLALDRSATRYCMQLGLINAERYMASQYCGTGIWTGASPVDPTWDWSPDSTTAAPIEQLRGHITQVHQRTGMRPNRLLINQPVWDRIQDSEDFLDRISGGATVQQPAVVMRRLLAEILEISSVHVSGAVFNGSVRGATAAYSWCVPNVALVYYAPDGVGLDSPTAGVRFAWAGLLGMTAEGMRIKRFRMEAKAADRIELDYAYDYKLTSPDLGALAQITVA